MGRSRWLGPAGVVVCAVCAACGTGGGGSGAAPDGGATGQGGGGGTSVGGGGPGGAPGGTGAGGALPSTKFEACQIYATAQCNRNQYECRGVEPVEEGCALDECPDILFSEGSLRTIEGLIACAEEWRNFPCDRANRGEHPPCAGPGSRPLGATCIHASQCASQACLAFGQDGVHPDCGRCVEVAAPGGRCNPSLGPDCPSGTSCSADTCGARVVYEPLPGPGAPCNGTCTTGLTCRQATTQDPRTCLAGVPLGGVCLEVTDCVDGAYCTDARCVAALPIGAPCASAVCVAGAFCYQAGSGPVCAALLGPGESCTANLESCREGLVCACTDTPCGPRICLDRLYPGEPCTPGDRGRKCVGGSECRNGKCEALDSQGSFLERCGG